MLLLSAVYAGGVAYLAYGIIRRFEECITTQKADTQRFYDDLQKQKNALSSQRQELEATAAEIFTLYELTSHISQQPNEEEAFTVFQSALRKSISFTGCEFSEGVPHGINGARLPSDTTVFSLKGKRRDLGYVIMTGLAPRDYEKAVILTGQFALALRRVKLYREIEELAITDSLTDVRTRRYFLERFEEELKRSKARHAELAFLMIDVDHFKQFNDRYGHLVGDQILRSIGSLVRENVREIDIVGRYGGEEFCVVLPDTDLDGAQFAAERIRAAVESKLITAYDVSLRATVSVGISSFPHDGALSAELIDKADWAMYRAKKKGRNAVCSFGHYE